VSSLILSLVAGCSGAPVTAQVPSTIQPPAVDAPTVVPTVVPTVEPTLAPTAEPTPIPAAQSVAAAVPPVVDAQPVADTPPGADAQPSVPGACDDAARPDPLPSPGSPRAAGFFSSFRVPLPPAPLYDPPGPKRVGLQAGHWQVDQVPPELHGLQAGAVGGGKQEWQVNLDVARRTAALLASSGVQVDVLPATVPERYQANAFIALHADGDTTGAGRGFKVTRPGFSSIPSVDDRLVDAINQTYGSETELPRDDEHISLRMSYYYAFNSRRYCHAVAPGVPQAIIEMAYLTNATDRQFLIGDPDKLAQALADSINAFLATEP
jgi:N-acetylmuramoyl-L-alanine amidase